MINHVLRDGMHPLHKFQYPMALDLQFTLTFFFDFCIDDSICAFYGRRKSFINVTGISPCFCLPSPPPKRIHTHTHSASMHIHIKREEDKVKDIGAIN